MGDSSMNCDTDSNTDMDSLIGIRGGYIDLPTSNKDYILNQLQPQIREELSRHTWEIISYNPQKFLVSHSEYKQIVFAKLEQKDIKKTDFNGNTIGNEAYETISYLNYSRIVIGAIPVEVTLNKNPLGLFDHKYTIRFATESNGSFTIGPKTLDEIVTSLKDRSLVYMSTKSTEALAIMINAFERNKQLIVKEDIDTPGFYFVKDEIRQYNICNNNNNNNNRHPKPIIDQTKKCCELLDILQSKFKKKDILPTLLKWSIISPFDYVLKQIHKKWIPWLYPYGWSNTGKTTLGEINCCIWNLYENKDSILPFTAVDTKPRFGEVLSKSTYPIVINEVGQLNDDKYKDMVEMFKTAITDPVARKKFVNKTNYTDIPSFSPCILTGNPTPSTDTGFRRRIIPIVFTEKDQYSEDEIKEFKKLFNERIKKELKYLGDFTANYIMKHQQLLLDDANNKDWKEIAELILTEMYKSVQRNPPEWIQYFVKENQLKESKEDIDLLFRSFLINKVNETYNKYYRSIKKDNDVPNLPFSSRLNFCLEYNLIPFLNLIKIDKINLIAITSDLIHELKNKIPQISSLNEIASIINGFKSGQKRIGGNNVRTAYGANIEFLDFLGME